MITTFELYKARELQRHNDIVNATLAAKEKRGAKPSEIAHDIEQAREVYLARTQWAADFFEKNRVVVYFNDLEHFIQTVVCGADLSWCQQNMVGKLNVEAELRFLGFELESEARAYIRRWL